MPQGLEGPSPSTREWGREGVRGPLTGTDGLTSPEEGGGGVTRGDVGVRGYTGSSLGSLGGWVRKSGLGTWEPQRGTEQKHGFHFYIVLAMSFGVSLFLFSLFTLVFPAPLPPPISEEGSSPHRPRTVDSTPGLAG